MTKIRKILEEVETYGYTQGCDGISALEAEAEIKKAVEIDEGKIELMITTMAIGYNHDNIRPEFIWKCSVADVAKAIAQAYREKL